VRGRFAGALRTAFAVALVATTKKGDSSDFTKRDRARATPHRNRGEPRAAAAGRYFSSVGGISQLIGHEISQRGRQISRFAGHVAPGGPLPARGCCPPPFSSRPAAPRAPWRPMSGDRDFRTSCLPLDSEYLISGGPKRRSRPLPPPPSPRPLGARAARRTPAPQRAPRTSRAAVARPCRAPVTRRPLAPPASQEREAPWPGTWPVSTGRRRTA